MTYLQDGLARLRALEPEDLDFLYRIENDTSLWQSGSTLTPLSRYTLREYISAAVGSTIYEMKEARFVVECRSDGRPVGLVDLFDFDPYHRRAGVGVVTDRPFQRQGYASAALNLLCEYSFGFLQLHQLYAQVACDNAASLALFRGAGFIPAGQWKDWIRTPDGYADVCLLQRISGRSSQEAR